MSVSFVARIFATASLCFFCVCSCLQAEVGDTVNIVVDHANDTVGVFLEEWCGECVEGSTLHVPAKPIRVKIINTGTSVYQYSVGERSNSEVATSDIGSYAGFERYVDPFLQETLRDTNAFLYPKESASIRAATLLSMLNDSIDSLNNTIAQLRSLSPVDSLGLVQYELLRDTVKRQQTQAERAVRRFEDSKRQFDRLKYTSQKLWEQMYEIEESVYGSKGVLRNRVECLDAINQLARSTDPITNAAARFRDAFDNDGTYKLSYKFPSMFANLRNHATSLQYQLIALDSLIEMLPASERERLYSLSGNGFECLNTFEEVMDVTLEAESIVRTVVEYETNLTMHLQPEQLRQASEPVLHIQARRDNKFVYEAATLGDRSYRINMESSSPVRPSLGLSFILSPDSQFAEYGLKQTLDGREEIIESGTVRDFRFTWGITVGLTYSFLDYQDTRGFTVWVPELTINPGNDVRAVALGTGVSFLDVLKVSGGMIWSKHQEPIGVGLGDIVDTPQEFRVSDTFGFPDSGKWFLSLSVFIRPAID